MDHERWLAPLTGVIAIGTGLSIVAVYAYGRSLPVEHEVTVIAWAPVPPEKAWELLSDPTRRPEWAPRVERIG
ncbi:MAG: SRPBCC family protein, partial [Myxococcales bacterium]|nr:SRPBCC family protein [Myxococcales bacterium]